MEVLNKERILVIQTAFIGDAVLTLPMLQKLKETFPDCQLDVICNPVTEEIFLASPFVNSVIVYDKRGKQKSFFQLLKFVKIIRNKHYTRIYSLHRSFRSALIVMLSNVRETYGFTNSSFRYVYKNLTPYNLNHHEVKRDLDLIGFDSSNEKWKILPIISVNEVIKKNVETFLLDFKDKNLVAVAPGAVWETKKYPAEYFSELIKFLKDNNFTVVLIGSQSDSSLCENIATKFDGGVISSAGKFSVPGTVQLLRSCELLITNDSAPTHFAMAANIPAITIYCSTIAGFGFYPYTKNSCTISYNELKCKPCGIHGYKSCPIKTFDCAHKLEIEKIKKQIMNILDERNK
ncbi:MAG: glycosyltransferase family 9 protein [Ignavibacteriales bacterium]|nr:glycosyltransferase family 9 protein [Ignavibacteriales bacterium]